MDDLNHESLADLTDGRTIAVPGSPESLSGNAFVIINQSADDEEAQKIAEELDGFDVTIQTTVDGLTRQHEMEDIVTTLMASETITRTDALQLAQNFERLADVVGQPETFTAVPSRTNLEPTKRYVRRVVYTEETKLIEQLQNFIDVCLVPIQDHLATLQTKYIPAHLEALDRLHEQAEDLSEDAEDSRPFLLYSKNRELIDTRLMPFTQLFNTSLDVSEELVMTDTFRALVRELSDPAIKALLIAVSSALSEVPSLAGVQAEREAKCFTLLNYLPHYTHNLISTYLERQLELLQTQCQTLCNEKARVVEKTPDQRRALAIETQLLCRSVLDLYRLVVPLKSLLYWTEETFKVFNRLVESSR